MAYGTPAKPTSGSALTPSTPAIKVPDGFDQRTFDKMMAAIQSHRQANQKRSDYYDQHNKLNRPFGSSRISRAVMALTDAAVRTLARSEAHAEFFAAPQRWATNVDTDQFGDSMKRWSAAMSKVLSAGPTEDGQEAHFGQFTAASMAPHPTGSTRSGPSGSTPPHRRSSAPPTRSSSKCPPSPGWPNPRSPSKHSGTTTPPSCGSWRTTGAPSPRPP